MAKDPYASLKQGLVGAWIPSVSGSGLLLPDLSGRGNNGALTNMDASDWVSSGTGRALDFDNSNDYITLPNVAYLQSNQPFTICWWERVTANTNAYPARFRLISATNTFAVIRSTQLEYSTIAFGEWRNVAGVRAAGTTLPNSVSQWQHFAIIGLIGPNTNATTAYRVFENANSLTLAASNVFTTQTGSVNQIGWDGLDNGANCLMDDIRIYNRALSDNEIRLLASDRGIGFKPNKKLSRFSTRYTYNPPKAKVYHTVKVRERDHKNLREGLVGAWCPSLSGSGNLLPDVSGRNNHGTLTNMGPEDWVSSQGGRALDFDYIAGALRQAVELPNTASVRGLATASLSFWCNLQAAPLQNAGLYFESTGTSGYTKFGVFQTPANALIFVARDSSTGSAFTVTHTPTAGVWLHVAGNYNANTDLMELFVNGLSVGTNTTAKGVLVNEAPAAILAIGAYTDTTTQLNYSCSALIDDVRVYSKVLSLNEIRLLASRRGIGLQHLSHRSYAKEKKTALRRLLLTGQT